MFFRLVPLVFQKHDHRKIFFEMMDRVMPDRKKWTKSSTHGPEHLDQINEPRKFGDNKIRTDFFQYFSNLLFFSFEFPFHLSLKSDLFYD